MSSSKHTCMLINAKSIPCIIPMPNTQGLIESGLQTTAIDKLFSDVADSMVYVDHYKL